MASTVKDNVLRWRKKLDRNDDEYSILSVLHKLSKVSVSVDLLQDTGIGKVIRSLAKKPGKVGEKASALLHNWRKVVAVSQKSSDHSPKASHVKHNSLKHENSTIDNMVAVEHSAFLEKKSNKEKKSPDLKYEQDPENISVKSKDILKSRKKLDALNNSFQKNLLEKKLSRVSPSVSDDEPFDTRDYYSEGTYINNLKRKDDDLHTFEDMQPKSKKLKTSADLSSHDSSEEKGKKFISNKQSSKTSSDSQSHNSVNKDLNTKKVKESKTKKVKEEKKSNSDLKKTLKMQSTDAFTSSEVTFEDCLSFNDIVTVKRKKSSKTVSSPAKSKDKSTSEKKKPEKDQSRSKYTHKHSTESKSKHSNDSKSKHSDHSKSKHSDHSGSKHSDHSGSKHSDHSGSKHSDHSRSKHSDKSGSKHSDQSRSKHSDQSKSKHSVDIIKPEESKEKEKLLLAPLPKLNEIDIASTLPQPQLNYKPLPQRSYTCSPVKRKALTNEDAIMFTSSKKEKTCVYSGKKQKIFIDPDKEFPTLQEFCTRVLIENIDAIEYLGGLPYYLMKPVLERCTPQQLETIEDYNPTLLEDTHELWKVHCLKDFRKQSPQENETWRDLYLRAFDEREQKLKFLTKNISDSMSKSNTGRLVKLTYVNSYVKPPRDVARKQERNGTALPVNHTMKIGPPSKASPRPTAPAINSAATSNAKSDHVPKNIKPKVAPLMAKTLKSMKQCFRR